MGVEVHEHLLEDVGGEEHEGERRHETGEPLREPVHDDSVQEANDEREPRPGVEGSVEEPGAAQMDVRNHQTCAAGSADAEQERCERPENFSHGAVLLDGYVLQWSHPPGEGTADLLVRSGA